MGPAETVKSVDTNILVRIIADSDSEQAETARAVISAGVTVPLTVLLELAWTLRSRYDFNRARLNNALVALLNFPEIYVEDEPAVRAALELHRDGGDIADVIHLVAARGSEAFATFDKGVPSGEDIGVAVELV
jgi:predicted nucleic-acid-binding protein